MSKRKKYTIIGTTLPPKYTYTQEEYNEKLNKAINIILDDLILNGHLKIGE